MDVADRFKLFKIRNQKVFENISHHHTKKVIPKYYKIDHDSLTLFRVGYFVIIQAEGAQCAPSVSPLFVLQLPPNLA